MKTWGIGMWIFFLSLVALIVGILCVICQNYIALGIFKYYLAYAGLLLAAIVWQTKREAKLNKHIHIHHYTLA